MACTRIRPRSVCAAATVENDMIMSPTRIVLATERLAVAEPRQDRRNKAFQPDRGDGLWQHQQARLDRREAEADLIEQREPDAGAAQSETREEAAAHRRAEGADPGTARDPAGETPSGWHGCRSRPASRWRARTGPAFRPRSNDARRTPPARKTGAQCRRRTNQAEDIERMALLLAVVRQVAIDEVDTQQADRDVDEEHPAPVEIGDDQPARTRPTIGPTMPGIAAKRRMRTRSALS